MQVKFVVQGYKKKADELWLDWLDYGPEMAFSADSILEGKTLQSICKSLQQLEVIVQVDLFSIVIFMLSFPNFFIILKCCILIINFHSHQHPYIYPNENIEFHETGVITIKKFSSKGSLRDVLCNTKVIM